jgi:hypothetical protein
MPQFEADGQAFFFHETGPNGRLWSYSERGLLSAYFYTALPDALQNFPDGRLFYSVVNESGIPLASQLGRQLHEYWIITEFDLGNVGFGQPDAALCLRTDTGVHFVFIEAKVGAFRFNYQPPSLHSKTVAQLATISDVGVDKLCKASKFNSSINGQLELKWRFVNAFRARQPLTRQVVSERWITLPHELMSCDRFYWRLRLQPRKGQEEEWRRVDLGGRLTPLFGLLSQVEHFYLLAISDDRSFPAQLSDIRLYDAMGELEADKSKYLHWLPLDHLKADVRQVPAGAAMPSKRQAR